MVHEQEDVHMYFIPHYSVEHGFKAKYTNVFWTA